MPSLRKVYGTNYPSGRQFQYRRNVIFHRSERERMPFNISEQELHRITEYLDNPTKTGFWQINAKWKESTGISKYIIEELFPLITHDKIEISSGSKKLKISLSEDEMEEIINTIGSRLSFIFKLFTQIYITEEKTVQPLHDYSERVLSPEERLIFDTLDIKKLKVQYNEAYEYFKDNIYFAGFNPTLNSKQIFRIKDRKL